MSSYNVNSLLAQFDRNDLIRKEFKAGETVFRDGEPVAHLYFVTEGGVRAERNLANGQPLVFFRAMGGSVLSEATLFLEKHPYTCVATVDSRLVLVRKERLIEYARRDWKFMQQLFSCITTRYTDALLFRELSGIRSADERLQMWFEWQVSMGEREFHLEGRMGSLGEDLGLTRESVYRSLARLEKRKFITRQNGVILVVGA